MSSKKHELAEKGIRCHDLDLNPLTNGLNLLKKC